MNRSVQSGPKALVDRFRSHKPAGTHLPQQWFAGFPFRPSGLGPAAPPAAVLPATLGRIGSLELKLARRPKDVKRAQRLRYQVFFEEMSAVADPLARLARRDMDPFDSVCDHLIVTDHAAQPARSLAASLLQGRRGFEIDLLSRFPQADAAARPPVVGTYRLLRQQVADRAFGFYSAGEFDIDPLIARHPRASFLELGRSCVLKPYRDKRTVELLWHGIWTYVLAHKADIMIGCASLEGLDLDRLALPLSYLAHFHAAPPEWRASALPERRAPFKLIPREQIDPRAALRTLPPLLKAYLRLGACVGDGAVLDHAFGTTDVLVVLPRSAINPRYVDYYGVDAGRHAA